MTDPALEIFHHKSLVTILAYAPTGLGHLRVTDALYHGLPKGVNTLLLGSQDKWIGAIYNAMSINPIARTCMEWMQTGTPQDLFTSLYRLILRSNNGSLYKQLETILAQRVNVPSTVLVVSTHFGLSHQLASLKMRLMKEHDVRLVVIVQVTDDSPQGIWYTPEADIIFVPSHQTAKMLTAFGSRAGLPPVRFEVTPYPQSPLLAHELNASMWRDRGSQLVSHSRGPIHVAIPVSGAAVGLTHLHSIMDELFGMDGRYMFHVVSKASAYTEPFLVTMGTKRFIRLLTAIHERDVVDLYEQLYVKTPIALEITKPSEQAFKSLLTPRNVGGSMLLFVDPVGRQEYDNLHFLERHHLIPTHAQQERLWTLATQAPGNATGGIHDLYDLASSWRGLRLPREAQAASRFISWSHAQGIFAQMGTFRYTSNRTENEKREVAPDGVHTFWHSVAEYLSHMVH